MAKNRDWYLENEPKPGLRKWIFTHMAMGAVYAALIFFGVILLLVMLRAFAGLLPDDPFALLDAGSTALGATV